MEMRVTIKRDACGQCIFVILIALVLKGMCVAEDRDYEYWFKTSVGRELTDDWGLRFCEKLTWTDNANEFRKHMSDLGFVYHGLADWLDLGFNFKKSYEKEDGRWLEENRPHVNLTIKDTLCGLAVSNRSRFEFRDKEHDRDYWRYRNKLTLAAPDPMTALHIKPYVAQEFFINLDPSDFDQYRIYAGFVLNITRAASLDLHYVWDTEKSGRRWQDINVIGTDLKLRF